MAKSIVDISKKEFELSNDDALIRCLSINENFKNKSMKVLMIRYNPILNQILINFHINENERKDYIQDLWIHFLSFESKKEILNLKAFLIRSLRNSILDNIKIKKIRENLISENIGEFEDNNITYDSTFEINNFKDEIFKIIEKITDYSLAVIFSLYYFDEIKIKDISEMLNINEWTIRKKIERTSKLIFKYLKENHNKFLLW